MSRPRHIAVVNVFFAPHSYGGATKVAEGVARHLVADHGIRVSAISAMMRPDLPAYTVMKVEADGIANHLINLPPGRSYAEAYANPNVDEQVGAILRGLDPDLVHVHCVQELGAGIIDVARSIGRPVVLSLHDFWWLCERQFMIRPDGRYCGQDPVRIENCRGCVDDLERARSRAAHLAAVAGRADLVTAPSTFARDLAVRSGLAPDRTVVWENGVEPPGPEFFAAQARRRAADPRPAFGFVGGPSQIKGWPLMRAAFSRIGRTDFTGWLVEGSLDGRWWHGRVPDRLRGDWQIHPRYDIATMDDFYAKIDVLLFLSQWKETFGLTIREALARGIRVIQTESGGTTEHGATEGVTLLPIGAGPEALLPALEAVLDRPTAHPAPLPATTTADQAVALLDLTGGVVRRAA